MIQNTPRQMKRIHVVSETPILRPGTRANVFVLDDELRMTQQVINDDAVDRA